MRRLFSRKSMRQFISYFWVGGTAALVEWCSFFLLTHFAGMQYLVATVTAFILSTTVNWVLGRVFTFRNSLYANRRLQELLLVFTVSAIGLGFNLVLMFLFVDVLRMQTDFLKTVAKIVATGIVFVWNFLARKMFIYKA